MTAPEIHAAFCDICCSAKTFTTQHHRDLWLANHPHQENYADE